MMGAGRLLAAWLCLGLSALPAAAQMTVEQAREEGRTMGQDKRRDPTLVPSSEAQAQAVPGYAGTTLPQGTYFNDPDRLVADAQTAKGASDGYAITTDAGHSRPTFSNAEILATTRRATAVENDPSAYLEGESYSGLAGSCVPLPAGQGTDGYYEATCNSGARVDSSSPVCRTPLVVNVTPGTTKYVFTCEGWVNNRPSNAPRRCGSLFTPHVSSGVCRERSREMVEYHVCLQGGRNDCTEPDFREGPLITYECDSAAVNFPHSVETVGQVINERRDEGTCNAATSGQTCEMASETCVDPSPTTRVINGVEVTRACWNWERAYSCNRFSQGNDCQALEANGSCTHLRDECLDEEPGGGPCEVTERVYRCPTPGGENGVGNQYICGDDVYCINGECEPIVREASTEFRDALVALHAIDQAGKEFDESNYRVFAGTRETCHKPVFGLINCCAGKVSGVVPIAAGAAALAGGPAAIAAFATPFLTMFACSQDEMRLDIKDRMGFCHRVGSYCSSSFLGVCRTRRTAFCCFESKLSRVLQEQGRVQLNKPWGAPRREQCQGFSIEEFASLDLSVMDFTEVYADFMDAAKLPDEVQTMADIQARIQDYYDLHSQ